MGIPSIWIDAILYVSLYELILGRTHPPHKVDPRMSMEGKTLQITSLACLYRGYTRSPPPPSSDIYHIHIGHMSLIIRQTHLVIQVFRIQYESLDQMILIILCQDNDFIDWQISSAGFSLTNHPPGGYNPAQYQGITDAKFNLHPLLLPLLFLRLPDYGCRWRCLSGLEIVRQPETRG